MTQLKCIFLETHDFPGVQPSGHVESIGLARASSWNLSLGIFLVTRAAGPPDARPTPGFMWEVPRASPHPTPHFESAFGLLIYWMFDENAIEPLLKWGGRRPT